jgi:HKD family nuclease
MARAQRRLVFDDVEVVAGDRLQKAISFLLDWSKDVSWAVAWATSGRMTAALRAQKKKINRLVVGTTFSQTDPEFLKHYVNDPRVVVVDTRDGVFHPKLYLFTRGSEWRCLIGSPNLTKTAFEKNHEVAILVTGDKANDPVRRDLEAQVDEYFDLGKMITQEWLSSYRLAHAASRKARERLAQMWHAPHPKGVPQHGDLLTWTWSRYAAEISTDRRPGSFDERLEVLRRVRAMLGAQPDFASLDLDDRRRIAGTVKGRSELGEPNWLWFGSMQGQGDFMRLVKTAPQGLSTALASIPPQGDVEKEHYAEFARAFVRAGARCTHRPGVACASRLLAMKRPDYFVCLNKANLQLCRDLGVSFHTMEVADYWDRIVEPIVHSTWWQSPRPKRRAVVWDARAALLDGAYYTG